MFLPRSHEHGDHTESARVMLVHHRAATTWVGVSDRGSVNQTSALAPGDSPQFDARLADESLAAVAVFGAFRRRVSLRCGRGRFGSVCACW